MSLLDAFKAANNVLLGAVQGIAELITRPGLINVDFADVRTVMSQMGLSMMGTGRARGENRALAAAQAAIASPLLEDVNLSGAKGVLVNITAGMNLSIAEFEQVGEAIKDFTSEDATVIVGTVIDPEMTDELRVTLVATGLGKAAISSTGATSRRHGESLAQRSEKRGEIRENLSAKFDKTVLVRNQTSNNKLENSDITEQNMDYLDIPAFLRRQSD